MRDATRIIRSTLSEVVAGKPLHAGPVFASPYHAPGDPSENPYTYARSHNPTWTALEKAIAELESGPGYAASALVFASGMAACTAVFGAVLRPGDVVVLPANAYFVTRVLVQEYFVQMGVTLRMAPTVGGAQGELLEGARLLWLETPSNPTMEVCDVASLCRRAHEAGALVAVDNTTATPLGQLPLALGADFSVASDAKAMTGHSDLMVGHVAVRDAGLGKKIEEWRRLTGGILGPMEAWLALRSLATLPLRMERGCENALRVARFLEARREVVEVLYPELQSHPGHAIAARQMKHFGPVLSFTLESKAAAETFLTNARLITEATSFGGVTTTAERRARWGSDDVHEGLIRMSVGCEAVEDLIEDMELALDSLEAAG
jgi:cystathionine gamma-lyase